MRVQIAGLALCLATAVFAQDHAVLNDEDVWKLYTTPQVGFMDIADDSAMLLGVGIGTILNDHWYFGARANILANEIGGESDSGDFVVDQWNMWDAGGEVGYIFRPVSLLHFDAGFYLGGGQVDAETGFSSDTDSTGFLVMEPDVAVAINLHETWEAGVGVGYRFVQGLDFETVDDDEFSDLIWRVFLRATEF